MTTRTDCRICDGTLVAEISKFMCDQVATKIVPIFEVPSYPDCDVQEVFCAGCGIVYRYEPLCK